MIIGLLQQKGGAGKTTLALNLAAYYAKEGLSVLLVDADPQGSAQAWSSVRTAPPLFPVVGMAKTTLHSEIAGIAKGYDITIIDGAPRANQLARSAILACDLILIPVTPSPFDVWASSEIANLITEAQSIRPNLKAAFVINRKVGKTVIGRAVENAFADLPFPVVPVGIAQRISFAETAEKGLTVFEVSSAYDARLDITRLAEAIPTIIQERAAA